MDIHAVLAPFLRFFRRRRMARFLETFPVGAQTTILDLGGTPFNWDLIGCRAQLTLLNLHPLQSGPLPPNYSFVQGDATRLEYGDAAFDIAYSNSVIGHLSTWERQAAFAREALRVGRGVWVQTPARWFPVEPSLMTPFIHFLPRGWQRRLIRNLTVRGLISRPSQEWVDSFLAGLRPLTYREMGKLFPGCEIKRERLLGLTKAYIAVRRPAANTLKR